MWVPDSKGGVHICVRVHVLVFKCVYTCVSMCACVHVCVVCICCCVGNLFISKFGYLSILLLVHPDLIFDVALLHVLQLSI